MVPRHKRRGRHGRFDMTRWRRAIVGLSILAGALLWANAVVNALQHSH